MTNRSAQPPPSRAPGADAGLLTLGGLAAAFCLAACCALPLLLTALGLGAAWLSGVALMAAPHRDLLTVIAVLGLLGGAVLLWRQQSATKDGACAPNWVRVLTLAGVLVGVALLWAGSVYG